MVHYFLPYIWFHRLWVWFSVTSAVDVMILCQTVALLFEVHLRQE